ncbi:cupin [Cupriavidus sp. SK-4]|uniref:2,4'-dihydroxyacetophenone dioxygenase family protein n=1 Tax=Cupriavidus sp. SK-4 TaxID=574750 RepID=UPI00044673B9|nr:2,4'-dihydroxyacetophenone dioxygenase family protein [Cupriavidus sp. SK-4]EYS90419.1 cupin [Cupriavidus sp. SK-4]
MLFESINTGCLDSNDTPWMPFAPYSNDVMVKYFKIDPVRGETITLLKAAAGMEMPRHHHTGTVIVYTVQGSWRYKEHDWIAHAGSVVYETASTRHTPQAAYVEGPDIITFNIVAGELLYLDDKDNIIAVENWKTSMDRYLNYCKANGIKPKDLSVFEG